MKVVIIGGGIAGLALAGFLRETGIRISIHERNSELASNGHAFMVHPEAMKFLCRIGSLDPGKSMPGQLIDAYVLRSSDNEVLHHTSLQHWICMKRHDLVRYLSSFFLATELNYNRSFSHFLYEKSGKVVAAVFSNGQVEVGDVFIGADGANSKVRKAIFGDVEFTPTEVKEVVGVIRNAALAERYAGTFTKYMAANQGLSFGLIPCSAHELVWFMQYDVKLQQGQDESAAALEKMCNRLLGGFPAEVREVIGQNDFSSNYLWHAVDFDLLPSFHQQNVLLIGDAAHLALPFTSAGITNALVDASQLAELLAGKRCFNAIGSEFYSIRSSRLQAHIDFGREIKNNFLQGTDRSAIVPLIING